jgi:two-component system CheB/CheR fusion protein
MRRFSPDGSAAEQNASEIDHDFEALLDYLKHTRGFDFTGYKRSSLIRRVDKRMQMVEVEGYVGYIDYLEVHPDEFGHLFNTILINVTAFFRDAAAWAYLRDEALPRMLAHLSQDAPIRVWCAGCASGEEAYTLTILLAEALGMDAFRERVKIYATDIDEEALSQARLAVYTQREVTGVPADLLKKYFESVGERYAFHKELRRAVIFGRHDLIQDAPISRIDLLTCRNALMYLNAEVQARVLSRLHFALDDGGILMLGKAEMLFTHTQLFLPLELRYRLFTKVPKSGFRDRLQPAMQIGTEQQTTQPSNHNRLREKSFEAGPIPQIVVDANGRLALVNDRARTMFRLEAVDLGRPLQDLELSYRPVDLRSLIDQVYEERRPAWQREVSWTAPTGEVGVFDVQVVPAQEDGGLLLGAAITFTDVTGLKRLQDDLQEANRELETAYEELQSTNEELETTNEELQSTIEELETTNEELQSTNEELEAMNEELQSTNEELQTMNEESRLRSVEVTRANTFLASILTSLRAGVVVLDQNLSVQIWNHRSEDLWGLRADEVQDKQFLLLDIGLPVEQLRQSIRDSLGENTGIQEQMIAARNRRGRAFACKVTCTPLSGADGENQGVILLMEDTDADIGVA